MNRRGVVVGCDGSGCLVVSATCCSGWVSCLWGAVTDVYNDLQDGWKKFLDGCVKYIA